MRVVQVRRALMSGVRLFNVREKMESALLLCTSENERLKMRDPIIYKILRQAEWADMRQDGHFEGSVHDIRDGFIHMSTAAQLQGTLDKHYTNGETVTLAAIRFADVAHAVKYEISRGGAEFPHIYGVLPLSAVETHWDLSPDAKGRYSPPEF